MEPTTRRPSCDYAHALTHWGDVGGYDAEVLWDTVTVAALGMPFDACKYRELATLSGGEQKRLALEVLLRGPDEVLLLDEPDNYLDVPGKRWLEQRLRETRQDRAVRQPRPGVAGAGRRPDRHRRGRHRLGARRRVRAPTTRPGRPARADGRAAPPLGGGARPADRAGAHAAAAGEDQRRPWPPKYRVDGAPAGAIRGSRAAAGQAGRAARHDAAARRPDRRARGDLRGPGARPG